MRNSTSLSSSTSLSFPSVVLPLVSVSLISLNRTFAVTNERRKRRGNGNCGR